MCCSNRRVLLALLIMAAIVLVFAFLNSRANTVQIPQGSLEIQVEGKTIRTLTPEDISKLSPETFLATIRSSSEGVSEVEFTAVLLKKVLAFVDPGLLVGRKTYIATASDSYATALTPSEVLDDGNVYIAFLENGKPIKAKAERGAGPLRLIIRRDQFGQRWVKFLAKVDVR